MLKERTQSVEGALSQKTPWTVSKRITRWFVAVATLGGIFLLIPRPNSWTLQHIFAEDGQIWITQTLQTGWSGIFDTYAGYLHVVPRLIANTCVTLGPESYIACTNVSSVLVKIALMAVVFPVVLAYASSWRWALFAASLFLLLPVSQLEVLGNITNLRWFLVVAAFVAILGNYPGRLLPISVAIIVLLASLSDPLTLVALPFAVWRLVRLPRSDGLWSRLPSIALLIGIVIHLNQLQPEERGGRGTVADLIDTPTQTIAQLLVRGPLVTQIGMTPTQDLLKLVSVPLALVFTIIPLAIFFLAFKNRTRPDPTLLFSTLMIVMGFATLFVTLSFPASYIAIPDIWSPSQPSRYSVLAGLFIGIGIVLLMGRVWSGSARFTFSRGLVLLSLGLMLFGFLSDSRGDPRHAAGMTWTQTLDQAREECARTGLNPTLTTPPNYEGWQTTLTCDWLR